MGAPSLGAAWGCEQPGQGGDVSAYSKGLKLDDLKGPFKPKPFNDSMTESQQVPRLSIQHFKDIEQKVY